MDTLFQCTIDEVSQSLTGLLITPLDSVASDPGASLYREEILKTISEYKKNSSEIARQEALDLSQRRQLQEIEKILTLLSKKTIFSSWRKRRQEDIPVISALLSQLKISQGDKTPDANDITSLDKIIRHNRSLLIEPKSSFASSLAVSVGGVPSILLVAALVVFMLGGGLIFGTIVAFYNLFDASKWTRTHICAATQTRMNVLNGLKTAIDEGHFKPSAQLQNDTSLDTASSKDAGVIVVSTDSPPGAASEPTVCERALEIAHNTNSNGPGFFHPRRTSFSQPADDNTPAGMPSIGANN